MAEARKRKSRPRIFTIGHSTRSIAEFVDILNSYKLKLLVDIRTIPKSRHNPQFGAARLARALAKRGIEYRHMAELGGLRHTTKDSPNHAWRNKAFRGYADYMQTNEFKRGLSRLISRSKRKRLVMMCAEAVPWRCHRSLVADALLVKGYPVEDIFTASTHRPHKLTSFAKVRRGMVTYPIAAFLFALLFHAFQAQAFINIEDVRRNATTGFNGTSSVNIGGQRGNTEKFSTSLSTLNIYRENVSEYLALGDYNVAETAGTSDTNNARAHLRYTAYPENEFSFESFAQHEFDQFRDLKTRDLLGENLRQRLAKTKRESFYAGYGTFFEYQDWTDRKASRLLRANLYLAYVREFDKQASLYGTLYYQPAWTALADLRLELQAGLTANITSRLASNTQLSVVTETRGAPNVKPTDLTYSTGLTLKY